MINDEGTTSAAVTYKGDWSIKADIYEKALRDIMAVSAPLTWAGIVGHQQVLDIAGKALANDPR